jgi:hypothetical protein
VREITASTASSTPSASRSGSNRLQFIFAYRLVNARQTRTSWRTARLHLPLPLHVQSPTQDYPHSPTFPSVSSPHPVQDHGAPTQHHQHHNHHPTLSNTHPHPQNNLLHHNRRPSSLRDLQRLHHHLNSRHALLLHLVCRRRRAWKLPRRRADTSRVVRVRECYDDCTRGRGFGDCCGGWGIGATRCGEGGE